jgi:DNA-binding NarL/FixJ family response regulator
VSGSIRVLVVDDQALVREGLMTLLEAAPGITPVAAAADGEEAVALAARHRPDVVLMDLRMPKLDGVESTRRIREAQPDTEIVVLTTHADEDSILDALRAGARGYLTKDAGIAEISRAVQAAAAHQALLDPVVHTRLIEAAGAGGAARRPDAARGRGPVADRPRPVQRRDRHDAGRQRGHGQDPHQSPVRQDRRAGPCAGGALRLHARPRGLSTT